MNDWETGKRIASMLVRRMYEKGWKVRLRGNGGLNVTVSDALSRIGDMDEDFMEVWSGEVSLGWVLLIYENGVDVISDWSVLPDSLSTLDEFVSDYIHKLEG